MHDAFSQAAYDDIVGLGGRSRSPLGANGFSAPMPDSTLSHHTVTADEPKQI
jgi:hypothetical protein